MKSFIYMYNTHKSNIRENHWIIGIIQRNSLLFKIENLMHINSCEPNSYSENTSYVFESDFCAFASTTNR